VGRPAGKRPLGRPKFRKEDNIRMDGTEWWSWQQTAPKLSVGTMAGSNLLTLPSRQIGYLLKQSERCMTRSSSLLGSPAMIITGTPVAMVTTHNLSPCLDDMLRLQWWSSTFLALPSTHFLGPS
jgi:hypothetical protein